MAMSPDQIDALSSMLGGNGDREVSHWQTTDEQREHSRAAKDARLTVFESASARWLVVRCRITAA